MIISSCRYDQNLLQSYKILFNIYFIGRSPINVDFASGKCRDMCKLVVIESILRRFDI